MAQQQYLSTQPSPATETGEIILRGRMKDAQQAKSCFDTLWMADLASSNNRAQCQEMIDGMPPFNDARDRLMGLWGRCNVNVGIAGQDQEQAEMPYNDLRESVDTLCTMPTKFGLDMMQRAEWEQIMEEEFSWSLTNWCDFEGNWQQNVHLFTAEGVSFVFWNDDNDWRYQVVGQQLMKFPRRTKASVSELQIVQCKVDMAPNTLYQKIRNEKLGKMKGWHRGPVLRAIKDCAPLMPNTNDYQEWERVFKDQDINWGITSPKIETIWTWVQETDGTVSMYISRYDGKDKWLYKCEGKYKSMDRVLCAYTYGVGSNGDFESIRGYASKNFSLNSALCITFCKWFDMAHHAATPMVSVPNESELNDLPLRPMGPYMNVEPNVTFPEFKQPNFEQNLIPLMEQIEQFRSSRSFQYTAGGANTLDRTERTKYEKSMQYAQQGKLTTSGMNLFAASYRRHMRETVRRFCRKDYHYMEPGGQEVWEFRRRCRERGVPAEAIDQIDWQRVEVNMGIGKGSVMEQRSVLEQLEPMYFRMDAYGQNTFNRLKAMSLVGPRWTNIIFPVVPGQRPPIDYQIANLQNYDLAVGQEVPVEPNDNHVWHLNSHVQSIMQFLEKLNTGAMPMEQAIPAMGMIWRHSNEHLGYMDPNNPETAQFKEVLQQVGEVIVNGEKHLMKEQERAEAEGMMNGGGDQSPANLVQAVQAQTEIENLMAQRQQNALQVQKSFIEMEGMRQKMALNDAKTAVDLRTKMMKAKAQSKPKPKPKAA